MKNLKVNVTEENLMLAFEPYGTIERVKKTKDYGFVHFEKREDAIKAMEELNGTVIIVTYSYIKNTHFGYCWQFWHCTIFVGQITFFILYMWN